MLKKTVLLAVFSGFTLFSMSVLSENVEQISVVRHDVYNNKVVLLDKIKLEASHFFDASHTNAQAKNQMQNRDNAMVSTAAGVALLVFGLVGFVMRASRPRV